MCRIYKKEVRASDRFLIQRERTAFISLYSESMQGFARKQNQKKQIELFGYKEYKIRSNLAASIVTDESFAEVKEKVE